MLKNKLKNIVIFLLNILLVVSLIFILTTNNEFNYALYWVVIPFLIVGLLLLVSRWSVLGLNIDKTISKTIQRSFDDSTTLSTVFYGIIFLIITFIDTIKEGLKDNPYVIIGFFIITLLYELIIYLSIYKAKKETAALLEKQYNKEK